MAKQKKKCEKCSKELSFLEICKHEGKIYCEKCLKDIKPAGKNKKDKKDKKSKSKDDKTDKKSKKTKGNKFKKNKNQINKKSNKKIIAAILLVCSALLVVRGLNIDLKILPTIQDAKEDKFIMVLMEALILLILAGMFYIVAKIEDGFKSNQNMLIAEIEKIKNQQNELLNDSMSEAKIVENIALKEDGEEIVKEDDIMSIEELTDDEMELELLDETEEEEIVIIDEDDELF